MTPAQSQSLVDRWNRKHKPGTKVDYVTTFPPNGQSRYRTKTRGVAYVENGVAMVSVEGVKEPVGLEVVEVI